MSRIQSQLNKYTKLTPTFRYIKTTLFKNKHIKIDYIAHRSFDYNVLKSYYQHNNFKLQPEQYRFDNINVEATWLKSNCYRIFLSEYKGSNNFSINSYEDYKKIQSYNDYVAWTLLHKDDINHVAITVDDIEEIIAKIKQDGSITLNNEDNPIQVSSDKKLLQASTIADKISYKFPNGEIHLVPYTFVEFIQRKDNREGFETANAATILKSTHL
jgi:4-hydroxyphenylpyruvate dioxygenase-like putative hemolysin